MNLTPRVAAVHDMSGLGRCSLTVALPVLSAMGAQCCPLPTAVLSAHTAFPAPTHFCDLPSRYRPEAARPLPAPNSERPNKRILTDDTTERNAVKWSQKKSADAPKQRCRTRFKPYAYRDALLYLSSSFRCFRHEVSLRRKEFKAGANRMHDCGPQIANDGYRNSERERIWHM